jgi:hypothetical protein
MVPISSDFKSVVPYPTDVRAGSVKLVGVLGGWVGGSVSESKNTTWTMPSDVNGAAGATVAGTKPEENPYDLNYKTGAPNQPYLLTQFYIKTINSTTTPGSNQLDVQSTSINIDAAKRDPDAIATLLTQKLSDSQGIKAPSDPLVNQLYVPNNPMLSRVDDPVNGNILFRRIDFGPIESNIVFDDTNTYVYWDTGTNSVPPYIIGAQQFSIEYGRTGNNFQLSYAHTPFQENAQPNEQMVGIYSTGTTAGNDLRFYSVTAATGIVIHDLQPQQFWEDLGLYDALVVPLLYDDNGVAYYDRDQFLQKITYGFLGLDGFPIASNTNWRKQVDPLTNNPTYLNVTGNSRAIIGTKPPLDTLGGCYYVEVVGFTRSSEGVMDKTGVHSELTALVSGEYVSGDIVTGYSDSSIPVLHNGPAFTITDVWIRILSGVNKEPITDLGPLNNVFLRIDRGGANTVIKDQRPPAKK